MRGSPLIRAAIVFAVILLAGLPVWSLTHPQAAQRAVETQKIEKQKLQMRLTFAHPPASIAVLYLGEIAWKETNPTASIEHTLNIEFPKEGVDLEIKAQWPANTPATAIRAQLTTPSGATFEKSVWGEGSLDEVVTFP
jgi:hypothetical protein